MKNKETLSLKSQAYARIKQKILYCEYAPNSILNETILLEDTQTSRTPLREALNRLEQEKLVKILPKKGILISDISINEINMIYETRLLIETFCVKTYGHKLPEEKLRYYRDFFAHELPTFVPEEIFCIDDEFHCFLYQISNNSYLITAMEHINAQNQRVRILSGIGGKRIIDSQHEHLAITEALLEKNYPAAETILTEHLQKSKKAMFDFVVQNGGWATLPATIQGY